MRHNNKPVIKSTKLAPNRISLREGWPPLVACSVCGKWKQLRRGMLQPHRAADNQTRCPHSGQRIQITETYQQWRLRLSLAEFLAANRR